MKLIGQMLEEYTSLMTENNYLDFSNIQVVAYNLLENNHEILKEIQENIKYVMVDEYQDTNFIQEKIVLKLTEPTQNLCVVGMTIRACIDLEEQQLETSSNFHQNLKTSINLIW